METQRAHERGHRDHDLVLFGGTGFTGGLTARYLAAHLPHGARWALAGRNRERLEELRRSLAADRPALEDLPLVHADVEDRDSVRALAESTRVVATTVGPFVQHGAALVAACADAGTDYADLCGEPEFVDRMYLAHHQRARATGARIVHACGFDCIPSDLGAWFTVQQLPEGVPLRLHCMVRAGGQLSGGTFASAMTAFSRFRQATQAAGARRRLERLVGDRPAGRRVRAVARPPHRDPSTGWWLVPLPLLDPLVVKRSAGALERYGPDFTYGHYAAVKRLPVAMAGVAGLVGLAAAAQVPPVRNRLLGRLPQGEGPDERRRSKSWFAFRFVGEGGGRRVVTEVSGGDPGYDETAKMLSETAMSLAFDDNPDVAGSVTTAEAMAKNLHRRLVDAGLRFDVIEA